MQMIEMTSSPRKCGLQRHQQFGWKSRATFPNSLDLIIHCRENKWKQHLMIFAEKRLDCRFRTRIMELSRELKIGANSAEFWFQGQVGHALTSTVFFQGRNVKWRCDWRAMMMPQKPSWSTASRRHLGLVRYFGVCGWWIVGLVWLDVNQYL